MKPIWRLLLAVLEERAHAHDGPLTATERSYLVWLRAWQEREQEELAPGDERPWTEADDLTGVVVELTSEDEEERR